MNSDILDVVPQFPGGPWVNHFIYGTILGVVLALALHVMDVGAPWTPNFEDAAAVVMVLATAKKTYDYVVRGPAQGEYLWPCVGKALLTPLGTELLSLLFKT